MHILGMGTARHLHDTLTSLPQGSGACGFQSVLIRAPPARTLSTRTLALYLLPARIQLYVCTVLAWFLFCVFGLLCRRGGRALYVYCGVPAGVLYQLTSRLYENTSTSPALTRTVQR